MKEYYMHYLYLSYFSNNPKANLDLELYFEYQQAIVQDLKWLIKRLDENFFGDELEKLKKLLTRIVESLPKNHFQEDPEMELNIFTNDDYLIFSYYLFNDKGEPIFDTPFIFIMTQDLKSFYFIDETMPLFYDEEEDDDYNRGYDEITFFKIEEDKIKKHECTLEEYTVDLFQKSFRYTKQFIMQIEKETKKI